jgi:hypothetical protein
VQKSIRVLVNEILDYAGLFPPAKLPLGDALRNYLRYRKESPHRWMLGRFVCPTARLADLLKLARTHEDTSLLSLTALGRQSSQSSEFVPSIRADVQAIQDFRRAWGQGIGIDIYEVALPKGAAIEEVIPQMPLAINALVVNNLRGFFEIPMSATWRADLEKLSHYLSRGEYSTWPGLKLRCGGVTADAFPSATQIAFFIHRCRADLLTWKATAGLHHPRGHWDESLQLWHHGFLNVFGAGLFASTNPLTEADLVAILSDREAKHFSFTEDRFSWKSWSCTVDQIADYRACAATSFGSCSFEEPRRDLMAMGLLDAAG